jgi:RND family efflux transporter MFP subunit
VNSPHPHTHPRLSSYQNRFIEKILQIKQKIGNKKLALAGLVLVIAFFFFRGGEDLVYEFAVAEKGNVIQQVVISGNIKPVETVDLGFEEGGKIKEIGVEVGAEVKKRDVLASLEWDDLQSDLEKAKAGVQRNAAEIRQAQASLQAAQVFLQEIKKGTRKEELAVILAEVESATKSLEDAKKALQSATLKVEADLSEKYASARNTMLEAVTVTKSALLDLTELEEGNFNAGSSDAIQIQNAKEKAIFELFSVSNAGRYSTQAIGDLTGGLYTLVQNLTGAEADEILDTALQNTIEAAEATKAALNSVRITSSLDSSERQSLEDNKSAMDSEISALSAIQKSIEALKAGNNASITSANAAVSLAQSTLDIKKEQLKLARAGSTPEAIKAQEARVEQERSNVGIKQAQYSEALAMVKNIEAQIDKRIIKAPFEGLISRQDAKVGEILPPNQAFITLITKSDLEIEAFVPEVSIGKLSVGNNARVTLDAYGDDQSFEAVITDIDPAETLKDELPTYKVTLNLTEPNEKVRPGMTANLLISAQAKEGVLRIPTRAFTKEGDKNIVKVLPENFEKSKNVSVEIREVQLGLRGSDGYVEVLGGLAEGERVLISTKQAEK